MTTKKRSKPLKSPTVITNNKDKQELSPVEEALLECCKKNQPVLLYGNDSIDLEELIERIINP